MNNFMKPTAALRRLTLKTIMISIMLALIIWVSPLSAQEVRWPPENPADWRLAFIDVETTGLIPGEHEMIDIGLILTDLDGVEQARLFRRVMPTHPERITPGAAAVNGFNLERWQELGAISESALLAELDSLFEAYAKDKQVLMVAFNSQFDAAFMQHFYREYERNWREHFFYFVMDIPSMAWILGLRGLSGKNIANALGIGDEPHDPLLHTGITGADLNLRIYRALLNFRKN